MDPKMGPHYRVFGNKVFSIFKGSPKQHESLLFETFVSKGFSPFDSVADEQKGTFPEGQNLSKNIFLSEYPAWIAADLVFVLASKVTRNGAGML